VYCGRIVAAFKECEKSGKGKNDDTFHGKFTLKKRPYLGPTSTDHELAFMMANQANIQAGDLVYEPFVGTGSIALALQYFGACVIGADLDMRVLKGYAVGGKTRNKGIAGLDKIKQFDVRTNFLHYKLPLPDFLAMDVSCVMFNTKEKELSNGRTLGVRPVFDAIVCDPPYGVRARSQKAGVKESRKDKEKKQPKNPTEDMPYFGMKEHFDFVELHEHLLDLAAILLRPGGHLVFLFHTDE